MIKINRIPYPNHWSPAYLMCGPVALKAGLVTEPRRRQAQLDAGGAHHGGHLVTGGVAAHVACGSSGGSCLGA
jgi:hypothetical protein